MDEWRSGDAESGNLLSRPSRRPSNTSMLSLLPLLPKPTIHIYDQSYEPIYNFKNTCSRDHKTRMHELSLRYQQILADATPIAHVDTTTSSRHHHLTAAVSQSPWHLRRKTDAHPQPGRRCAAVQASNAPHMIAVENRE